LSPSLGTIFLWETIGTGMLILLGTGVVATVVLQKSKGTNGGWLLINFGWAMAVFVGASVAWKSGAHLNPAVTIGLAVSGSTPWGDVPVYILAQLLGAFIGAVLAWAAFKKNFDEEPNPEGTLGIFSTGPAIRSYGWNLVTEVIGTFVLIFWILVNPPSNSGLGYAAVAFVVLSIGNSLGGPTGYAINPARDLGPRIAYAILPIRGKGTPDWGYSWVPIVGPIIGAVLAGLLYLATKGTLDLPVAS
jgi:glycerol uptake facilitator protein